MGYQEIYILCLNTELVNELFDKITDEQSYFDPTKEKSKFKPIVRGDYLGHITSVETRIVDVKRDGNYRARVYKYDVTIAWENKDHVGLKFKGTLWRFLEPKDGDDFDSNSGGNRHYLRFCETLNIECPTHTKTIDGEDIEMQALPNLISKDMIGKPVTAFVDKGREYVDKQGLKRNYYDCKFIKKWAEGEVKEVSELGNVVDQALKEAINNDEVPF